MSTWHASAARIAEEGANSHLNNYKGCSYGKGGVDRLLGLESTRIDRSLQCPGRVDLLRIKSGLDALDLMRSTCCRATCRCRMVLAGLIREKSGFIIGIGLGSKAGGSGETP